MSAYYCCCISFEGVDEDAPAGTEVGTVLVCKLAVQILLCYGGLLILAKPQ